MNNNLKKCDSLNLSDNSWKDNISCLSSMCIDIEVLDAAHYANTDICLWENTGGLSFRPVTFKLTV